ncbi:VOC family protein [Cellulomonas sp. P22]|uniref:VOC family protein n=1 Tax=Cellulomonas sp. P22 TaxID=3373189 RepID=UPI00379EFC54
MSTHPVTTPAAPRTDAIAAGTGMDAVTLLVGDLDTQERFYRDVLLLDVLEQPVDRLAATTRPDVVTLGRGTTPLVVLRHTPDLPPAQRGSAGLFHTALVFDDRAGLATTIASLARHAPQTYAGSADHLVSQAFYVTDPEGNGVELYWDRPRAEWAFDAQGQVRMDSLRLDPNEFLRAHLPDAATPVDPFGLAAGTRPGASVGHVHLQVGDVPAARGFYVDALGFDVMAEFHGALFVSAGGYHHHVAVNSWSTAGAGPRASALGLGEMAILVPTADDVAALGDRLAHAGIPSRHDGLTLTFADPWRNVIAVTAG